MHFHLTQPSGILAQYIRYYWTMESDYGEGDVSERVIPLGNVQLMFHYKKPFVIRHPDNTLISQPRSVISGISKTYSDVSTSGEAGMIAVSFFPAGACHFFNFPLLELKNQSINLRDVLNKEIRQVEEMIGNATFISERVHIIEDFLLKRFVPVPHHDYLLIKRSIELIKSSKGESNASELSEKLSVTSKNLERKFSVYLGSTPKQFIKLIRFQKVILDLNKKQRMDLSEYAYRNGYFDQSHFIKDFKMYSGYTPKEFQSLYPCNYAKSDFI